MPALYLDSYLPSSYAPGCCTNQLYALVFNDQHQALKDNGSGILTLQSYTSALHNSFAIALAEHAERTKYFYASIDSTLHALPALARGKYYFLEIWRHEGALPRVRATDELIEARRFSWDGSTMVDAVLSESAEGNISGYVAHLASVYDSATLEMKFMAWLEKGGKTITNPASMNLLWKDSAGATLANVTQGSYMVDMPGVYKFAISNVTLVPDEVTIANVSITDANGAVHDSMTSIISWD